MKIWWLGQGFKKAITKYSEDEQEDYFFSYDNVLNASFIGDVLNYLYAHEDIFATLLEDMKKATPNDYLASSIQPEIGSKMGALQCLSEMCRDRNMGSIHTALQSLLH